MDPLSLNLYTYCHNEPLMYSDPTGHEYIYHGQTLSEDSTSDNMAQRAQRQAMNAEYSGQHISNAAEAAMVSAGQGGDKFKAPTRMTKSGTITEELKVETTETIIVSGSEYQSLIQNGTDVENMKKPTCDTAYFGMECTYDNYNFWFPLIHEYSGPIDPDDRFKYNFIEPAIAQIKIELSKGNENITWIVSSTGYSKKDQENFSQTADDLGVKIIFIADKNDLKNYINTGDIGTEKGKSGRKINAMSFFAHGAAGAVMLGYHQDNAYDLQLDADFIKDIDPNSFSESSMTYFYSCNSATPDESDNNKNIAQEWAKRTGSIAVGYYGKTDYSPINADENKDRIKASRKATGYDQNGEFIFPIGGKLDDNSGPTTMKNYQYDKDGNMKIFTGGQP